MDKNILIILIILLVTASMQVTAWNMRALASARPYLEKLSRSSDVMVLSEHRLYNCQLHKMRDYLPGYSINAKSSHDLNDIDVNSKPGHCGIAIAWKEQYDRKVKVLKVDSDRICGIKMVGIGPGNSNVYVIGVYMPHQACVISDFTWHLGELERVIQQCCNDGECILIGDYNVQFSSAEGPRFNMVPSANGKAMSKMLERQNLTLADGLSRCKGPTYSFFVPNVGESYIDHIAVSKGLIPCMKECMVYEDDPLNMSDHLPIGIQVDITKLPSLKSIRHVGKITWQKMSEEDIRREYTDKLDEMLLYKFPPNKDLQGISLDTAINQLVCCMDTAASHLKRSKFSKGLKPFWSNELNVLHRRMKDAWHSWDAVGKPRDPDNSFLMAYKNCKRIFRSELRRKEREYETEQVSNLVETHDIDHVAFWSLVNKSRKHPPKVSPVDLGTTILTDPEDICNEWGRYFKRLYTPKDHEQYDSLFHDDITSSMEDILVESYGRVSDILREPLTEEEVSRVCKSLKNKKAPGWDMITSEHIKFGGPNLVRVITMICNRISLDEQVPPHYKKGLIVPIPKGTKDQTIQDNNRGITLLPVLAKVYEKAVYCRYKPWERSNDIITDLQGANQEHCSSLQTTWLLRETIASNREQGNTVYVGLLDTSKAFDTVWIDGMLYQLYLTGMDGKLWRILRSFYQDFKCAVRIGGHISEWFTASQGVHQGAYWSMEMYMHMHNDMLKVIKRCGKGCQVRQIKSGNPTFADDISLSALYKPDLQHMLNIAYQYSQRWRFQFNAGKSEVMIFGQDQCPDQILHLGADPIKTKRSSIHMGVILSPHTSELTAHTENKLQTSKRDLGAILSLGSANAPVPTNIGTKLYRSLCLSKICYGCEIAEIPDQCVEKVEQFHGQAAKRIQGLPPHSSNATCLAPLGWLSLRGHIDFLMMTFLWRMILLPVNSIYKQVLIARLYHCIYEEGIHLGPVKKMVEVFVKYNLLDTLMSALISADLLPIRQFKRHVKNTIFAYENRRFKATMLLYKDLKIFKACVTSITEWAWWTFCNRPHVKMQTKARVVARLLQGESCLLVDCNKITKNGVICRLCSSGEPEDLAHLLFVCEFFQGLHNTLWNNVISEAPFAMLAELGLMSPWQRTRFFMSGLGDSFIPEWENLYDAVLEFIFTMYKCRLRQEQQLQA